MNNPEIIQHIAFLTMPAQVPDGSVCHMEMDCLCLFFYTNNTQFMEAKNHTLAFVRWINACCNIDELSFCNQALFHFLIHGDGNYQLPTAAWKDINDYLSLCMHVKRQELQHVQYTNILTH